MRVLIFILMLFFILNPYTVLGPLAYGLAPLLIVPFYFRLKFFRSETLILSLFLIVLSLIGVFSSFLHGIGQFVHLKVSVSILVYIFIAYSVFIICNRRALGFNDLVYVALLVVLFNSVVILAQVSIPAFRDLTESFLVPSGNVDWTEGLRYRGLASGGGASLSVLIPVSITLALYLYTEKFIGLFQLITISSILMLSLFFIGRTGFILLPFVFLCFVFFNLKKYISKVVLVSLVAAFLLVVLGDEIKSFVIAKYGVGFYNYSFGFLLGGVDGLKEEGTIDIIIDFLRVMPTTFPEVLIGYGFYGGSDFEPWTDSGYSRMFLSVGYLFGLMFYFIFFFMFRNVIFHKKYLFLTIGCVLIIAEAKEPLLFTGYASRVYIMLLVFALLENNFKKYMENMRRYGFLSSTRSVKAD